MGLIELVGGVETSRMGVAWLAGGVIGRIVGVKTAVSGSEQARAARINMPRVMKPCLEMRRIMLEKITLPGKQVVQDEE
jgi:hypothetical protein